MSQIPPQFSLVIPLWNEEKNIDQLVNMLSSSGLPDIGLHEAVLVNNGSMDQTAERINHWAKTFPWIKPVHLKENLNYGGGVFEGFQHCLCEILAYIPGDLQVSADDLKKVWQRYIEHIKKSGTSQILVKGQRTIRKDGFNTRFVSKVYTFLSNAILKVHIKDVNGLPKMFHKDLLQSLPKEKMRTFVFDAQLILTTRKKKWPIIEVPVTFHARREGVSSWSSKRVATYLTTIKQMIKLKTLKYPNLVQKSQ